MKFLKSFVATLLIAASLLISGHAYAAGVAVVDVEKVLASYQKAQNVSADMKVQEAELQKFLADAQKKLQEAKTPIEKKNLEEKLSAEFKTKSDTYRDNQMLKWKDIEDCIIKSIKTVSDEQKFDVVIKQSAVIIGGTDITDQVLSKLNAALPPTTAKPAPTKTTPVKK